MTGRPSLDDYVDVAERVVAFNEKYPEGSLQGSWEPKKLGEQPFVVYRALAYRTPDDSRPGVGTAWEPFPGTTPYTRNSELMNAETAAWGRAIVAVGITANRKLASRQEVQARQAEQVSAGELSAASNGTEERRAASADNGETVEPAAAVETASPQATTPEEIVNALWAAIPETRQPMEWLRMQLVTVGAPSVPQTVTKGTLRRLSPEQAGELLGVLNAEIDRRDASA